MAQENTNVLGFDLYLVDIYGLLDREGIYGYGDDVERFVAFQISVVDWLSKWQHQPDVVHVHDHLLVFRGEPDLFAAARMQALLHAWNIAEILLRNLQQLLSGNVLDLRARRGVATSPSLFP